MKISKTIRWTPSAEQDLVQIVEYIFNSSPVNAEAEFKLIKSEAERLRDFPKVGRIIPELEAMGIFHFRELIVPPWRIWYREDIEEIFVLAVVNSRKSIDDLVFNRLYRELLKE